MTREEAKELLPIIQAFAEGKSIQVRNYDDSWRNIDNEKAIMAFGKKPSEYRIKPEPKYRPFKTQKECWEEMHKHPDFGWVKRVNEPAYISLDKVEEIGRVDGWTFEDIFDKITFTDGEPFGIKEEQV